MIEIQDNTPVIHGLLKSIQEILLLLGESEERSDVLSLIPDMYCGDSPGNGFSMALQDLIDSIVQSDPQLMLALAELRWKLDNEWPDSQA